MVLDSLGQFQAERGVWLARSGYCSGLDACALLYGVIVRSCVCCPCQSTCTACTALSCMYRLQAKMTPKAFIHNIHEICRSELQHIVLPEVSTVGRAHCTAHTGLAWEPAAAGP